MGLGQKSARCLIGSQLRVFIHFGAIENLTKSLSGGQMVALKPEKQGHLMRQKESLSVSQDDVGSAHNLWAS